MKLLIAGFNTRAFAESAVSAGFNVDAVDRFGDVDQCMQCRVHSVGENTGEIEDMAAVTDKVLCLLDNQKYDYFCYTSGYENRPEFLAEIQNKGVQLLGNSFEVNVKVRNVLTVSKMLNNEGFFVPLVISPKGESNGRRWVKKPVTGGGGRSVEFTDCPGSLPEGFFAQEFIPGMACSVVFLSTGKGCRLLGVSEQLVGTGAYNGRQFGYAGNIFPVSLPSGEMEKTLDYLEHMAGWFSTTFGLMGLNGIDFIYDGKNCWFIEINPRYTASMELVEMASGISMAGLHLDANRGILPSRESIMDPLGRVKSGDRFFYGKKIVYTDQDIQIVYCPELGLI